jgi:hypothetical protein
VKLDFSFPTGEKDTALKTTRSLFYEDALPLIEEILDSVEVPVYIDRLEIDLGKISPEYFREKFYTAFMEEMRGRIKKTQPVRGQEENPGSIPAEVALDELITGFAFYLENGYWSWNIVPPSRENVMVIITTVLKKQGLLFFRSGKLQNAFQQAAGRLYYAMEDNDSLYHLLFTLMERVHTALQQQVFQLRSLLTREWDPSEKFGQFLFAKLLFATPILSTSLLKAFLQQSVKEFFKNHYPATEIEKREIYQQLADLSSSSHPTLSFYISAVQRFTYELRKSNEKFLPQQSASIAKMPEQAWSGNEETINIQNAGLVLIHPYLPMVFKELGWIDERKKFTSRTTQQKAIIFLQLLVNGKSRQQEHFLVLNKLLCNWPVNLPMKTSFQFTAKEKMAATDLITSLKEHWTVMKNTTPAGLAASFFARKGIIRMTEDGFILQVEKNTIDILLEDLPFGIQTIKLPWNEYIIHTEWTY